MRSRNGQVVATVALLVAVAAGVRAAAPTCTDPEVALSLDHAWAVATASVSDPDHDPVGETSAFRWLADGEEVAAGTVGELLHLPLDGTAEGSDGELPAVAAGLVWQPGRWGSAVTVGDGGGLAYERTGNLSLAEGTLELWTALTADGNEAVYAEQYHVLLHYQAPDGDWLGLVQSADSGVLFFGGEVGGRWMSAWSNAASTRYWKAGEWHHVVCTWSESGGFLRMYLDGRLVADTNDGPYAAPSDGGDEFAVGCTVWGDPAAYRIDELRTLDRAIDGEEAAARAGRTSSPAPLEVWLELDTVAIGSTIVFELTPSDGWSSGTPCSSAPWSWSGVPVTDPQPPSTLLAAGSRSLNLTVRTPAAASCRWAVGELPPWAAMTPFDSGSGSTVHSTVVTGVDPTPTAVNRVWIRSDAADDFALELTYRCLGATAPGYPRTGNLWGIWGLLEQGLEHVARIDLLLGADALSADQIEELRRLNPAILVLASINAVEHPGLDEEFYLRDTRGNRIEVWPGSYRLNLTKPEVAEHQARLAYQRLVNSGLAFDGVFFDNVFTSQSWLAWDIYGNPVALDADQDGVEDDPEVLDAAWKAGVLHEIDTFRQLMPDAIVTGHAMSIAEPGIADRFNGISLGFVTANVLEGESAFTDLWRLYEAWEERATAPVVNMFESSPVDQLAYGYDYAPWDKVPPETEEFARTFFPWMRFGLALTLMRDGYFAHEWGDTWHGNDWWYDELDFDLGLPLGSPERVDLGVAPGPNEIVNGSFEEPIVAPWSFWAYSDAGAAATLVRDTSQVADGEASARVDISAISGVDWHVQLKQDDRSLSEGTTYDLQFAVRADRERTIVVLAQKGAPDWDWYGLGAQVGVSTDWREVVVPFTATATASDASVQFLLGTETGSVWIDDVRLTERPPDVYRRDFSNGVVLLNGSNAEQTVQLGPGFRRLSGNQAPRVQEIVDDGDPGFSTSGTWSQTTFESGEWQAAGPFYHDWGDGCRLGAGAGGEATWALEVPFSDLYTVAAWWPAAPDSNGWSARARFEIVASGTVVASATLDERTGGDRWHLVGQAQLEAGDDVTVRLSCLDDARCIADALYVQSEARYNDGSVAESVTLAPLDGIVLQRKTPLWPEPDPRRPRGRLRP